MSFFSDSFVISKKIYDKQALTRTKAFTASLALHGAILSAAAVLGAPAINPAQSEERMVISLAEFTQQQGDKGVIEQHTQPKNVPQNQPEQPLRHRTEKAQEQPAHTAPETIPSPIPTVSSEASAPLTLPLAAHAEPPVPEFDSPRLAPAAAPVSLGNPDRESETEGAALGHIRAMIEKALVYPAVARKLRLEGTAMISFVLKSDGTVDTVKIISTSGSRSLDTKAVQTILSLSGHYPALGRTIELSIPVAFALTKNKGV